jgi:hypothetical protein
MQPPPCFPAINKLNKTAKTPSQLVYDMNLKAFVPAIVAAVTLALPATSEAGKVKVHRDLDGDGHYNKKTYDTGRHHGRYNGRYYGRGYGYGGYGYGGYGYGYPYRYGYRDRYWGSPYYGPSLGVSFYSRPTYTYSSRVYRGSVADNSLAADVQRALKSRGYYYGSVDGLIGSGSRAAIRAYQRDRGLSITGRIDRALLRSLRIG